MTVPVAAVLHRVRLPLRAPHVAAHGTESVREVVLVGLRDADGATGWGECPTLATPGYSPETTDVAWSRLRDELVPGALAGRPADPGGGAMAAGAVRDALLDLELRRTGSALPAGAPRVPFGVAVGLADEVDAVVVAAGAAAAAGAALVVLKVRPGWSVEPLAAVRRALPGLAVAVDANGSFTLDGLEELRALDALGPVFVEQPVAAAEVAASAAVAAALAAPVALDEAVTSGADLDAAVAAGAGRALTLKPARVGGYAAAVALADRARAAGWMVHVGGMLESGLGRAVARRLAARPGTTGPGLVGPTALLFAADVVAPSVAADAQGRVAVPSGPGLAPAPDRTLLAALTVDRWATGGWGGPG